MQFLNNYDRQWNETGHTCSLSNGLEFLKKMQFLKNYDRQWNETRHLFTIKWGTHYNNPVICISRVICPCFGIVHRNLGYCFSITQYTCIFFYRKCWLRSVDKRRQLYPAFYLSYFPFFTCIFSKNTMFSI